MKTQIITWLMAALLAVTATSTNSTPEAAASATIGAAGEANASAPTVPTPKVDAAVTMKAPVVAAIATEDYKKIEIGATPEIVTFGGGVAGIWLTVERHNTKAYDAKGFDPSYTSIVCDFKPVPKKRADGKWEIEFVSDLGGGK